MFIRKLFFLAIILFSPYFTFAMQPPSKKVRTNVVVNKQFIQTTLMQKILHGIHTIAPEAIDRILSSEKHLAMLTDKHRDDLHRKACESQDRISAIHKLGSEVAIKTTDQTVKEKFSFDTEYENAKKITFTLYAFKFLKKFTFPQVLFSPRPYRDDLRPSLDKVLEALIMNEQQKISICCFHLTLYNIADTLVRQKNMVGVTIELVTDQKQGRTNPPLQALKHLVNSDILVFAPRSRNYETNHHKFIIFNCNILNKRLVWHGSYNLTGHANKNSWDDIVILDDADVIDDYLARFEEIKAASQPMTREELHKIQTWPSEGSFYINNVPKELQ